MILQNFERYIKDDTLRQLLGPEFKMSVNFIMNESSLNNFCGKYYSDNIPRVVICADSPRPHQPGKTGIPFIDTQLVPLDVPMESYSVDKRLEEFYLEVLKQFGMDSFFRKFYVTNISSLSFSRGSDRKSIKFDKLPSPIVEIIKRNFLLEMAIIQPTHVICLGSNVQNTVRKLLHASVDCSIRLPHPSWILAAYCRDEQDQYINRYLETLSRNFQKADSSSKCNHLC